MNLEFSLLFLLISLKVGLSELTVDYTPPNRVVCKFQYEDKLDFKQNYFIAAELVCTDRDMQLHVLLEKRLKHPARIFVKEQSANPRCVHHYETNSDHNALMFKIPLSTCGMQRVQQHTVISFFIFCVHSNIFRQDFLSLPTRLPII